MTKKSINWEKIKGLMIFSAFVGVATLGITAIVKEESQQQAVRDATSVRTPEDSSTTHLISSDIVEIKKDDLSHFFNFNYGYVVVAGKVNDQKMDASFTFNQFSRQDRIEDARNQGCAIAAASLQNLMDDDSKDSRRARDNATLFIRNHCPQQAPAP